MLGLVLILLLVSFMLVITLALIAAFPMMLMGLAEGLIKRQWSESRKLLLVFLLLYGGVIAGSALAWSERPAGWSLPLWETALAGGHADIYGHRVEHTAEGLFFFVILCGDLGAILAGTAGLMIRKYCLRRSVFPSDPVLRRSGKQLFRMPRMMHLSWR